MPLFTQSEVQKLFPDPIVGAVRSLEQGDRLMEGVAKCKSDGACGAFMELIDNGVSESELCGYGPDQQLKRAEIRASATVQSDGRTFLTVVSSTKGFDTAENFDEAVKLGGDYKNDKKDTGLNNNHHGTRVAACLLGKKEEQSNGLAPPETCSMCICSYAHGEKQGVIGVVGSCINANPEKETVICDSTRSYVVLREGAGPKFAFIGQKDLERTDEPRKICTDARDLIIGAVANNGKSIKDLDYYEIGRMESETLRLVNPLIPLTLRWQKTGALGAAVQITMCDIGTQDETAVSYKPSDCKVQVDVDRLGQCDILLHDGRSAMPDNMAKASEVILRGYDIRETSIDIFVNDTNVTKLQRSSDSSSNRQAHLKIMDNLKGENKNVVVMRHVPSGDVAFTMKACIAPASRDNPLKRAKSSHPGVFYNKFLAVAKKVEEARIKGLAQYEKVMRKELDTIHGDCQAGVVAFVSIGNAKRMIYSDPTIVLDFNLLFPARQKATAWNQLHNMRKVSNQNSPQNQFTFTFDLLFFNAVDLSEMKNRLFLQKMLVDHYKGTLIDCFTPPQMQLPYEDFHRLVKYSFMQKNVLGWRERTHLCPSCRVWVPKEPFTHGLDTDVVEKGGVPYNTAACLRPPDDDLKISSQSASWVTGLYCCAKCARDAKMVQTEARKKLAADAVLDIGNHPTGAGGAYCMQHMWSNMYIQLIQNPFAHTQCVVQWHSAKLFGALSNSNKQELRDVVQAGQLLGKTVEEMRVELMALCLGLVLNHPDVKEHAKWILKQNVLHEDMQALAQKMYENLQSMRLELSKKAAAEASADKATSANNDVVKEAAKQVQDAEEKAARALAQTEKAECEAREKQEKLDNKDEEAAAAKLKRDSTNLKRRERKAKNDHKKALDIVKAGECVSHTPERRAIPHYPLQEGDNLNTSAVAIAPHRADTHVRLFGLKMKKNTFKGVDGDTTAIPKSVKDYVVIAPTSKMGDATEPTVVSALYNTKLMQMQKEGLMWASADFSSKLLPLESDDQRGIGWIECVHTLMEGSHRLYKMYTSKKYKDLFEVIVPCTSDGSLCDSVTGIKLVADDLTRKMKEINFTLKRSIVDNDSPSAPLTDSDDSVVGLPWSSGKRKAPITEETTAASKAARELPIAPGAAGSSTAPMELDAEEVNVPFPTTYVEELDG